MSPLRISSVTKLGSSHSGSRSSASSAGLVSSSSSFGMSEIESPSPSPTTPLNNSTLIYGLSKHSLAGRAHIVGKLILIKRLLFKRAAADAAIQEGKQKEESIARAIQLLKREGIDFFNEKDIWGFIQFSFSFSQKYDYPLYKNECLGIQLYQICGQKLQARIDKELQYEKAELYIYNEENESEEG